MVAKGKTKIIEWVWASPS